MFTYVFNVNFLFRICISKCFYLILYKLNERFLLLLIYSILVFFNPEIAFKCPYTFSLLLYYSFFFFTILSAHITLGFALPQRPLSRINRTTQRWRLEALSLVQLSLYESPVTFIRIKRNFATKKDD